MIRPITCICAVLALSSGLYLYQAKHAVQLLDRQIEKTVKETDAIRDHTRLLHAEWMLLNDPERLRQFADRYLGLKTVTPPQFTTLADLHARLPASRAPEPPPSDVPTVTVEGPLAGAGIVVATEEPAVIVADEVLPIPPMPIAPPTVIATAPAALPSDRRPPARSAAVLVEPLRPVAVPGPEPRIAAVRPADTRFSEPPRPALTPADTYPHRAAPAADPRVAASRPIELRPPEVRQTDVRQAEARPPRQIATAGPPAASFAAPSLAPRTVAAPAQPVAVAPAYGGSMLGMAARSSPGAAPPVPLPRPVPVHATQWSGGD